MRKAIGAVATLLVATTLGASVQQVFAKPVTFTVNDAKSRDQVSFTSDAPLELIQGHTNKVTGNVTLDDSLDLSKKPLNAEFAVDLATIDTGIPLRNEHMRDNFLETKKYPKAIFKLTGLQKDVVLKAGEKQRIMADGEFTVHGKTVKKSVPVDVTWFKKCKSTEAKMPGCDLLQIRTEFPVAFKDHDIKRPEVVFQKLADTVNVQVAATAWVKAR